MAVTVDVWLPSGMENDGVEVSVEPGGKVLDTEISIVRGVLQSTTIDGSK